MIDKGTRYQIDPGYIYHYQKLSPGEKLWFAVIIQTRADINYIKRSVERFKLKRKRLKLEDEQVLNFKQSIRNEKSKLLYEIGSDWFKGVCDFAGITHKKFKDYASTELELEDI